MVTVDLDELHHKPLPARSQRGRQSVTEAVATLKARVAELEAELAKAEERSAGHRADFKRERDRTDQMVTAQDRLITELENLRTLLQAAQRPARHAATRLPPRPRLAMDARDRVTTMADNIPSGGSGSDAMDRLRVAIENHQKATERQTATTRWLNVVMTALTILMAVPTVVQSGAPAAPGFPGSCPSDGTCGLSSGRQTTVENS